MAFNSWDKLAKAQRDYPRPKFAALFVDKNLKKLPNNPYLLTWKVDLALQQNSYDVLADLKRLSDAHRQPTMDTELLVYMYRVGIETIRRSQGGLSINLSSIGNLYLGTWQSTAKGMKNKKERMSLWNLLFSTAIQEDCWDDVRYAITNYNKEGVSDKKQSHYALIIATQLAAEQKFLSDGPQDRMARLQQDVALKMMKQAYEAPPEEVIAIQSIRDLRFMGEIFGRQRRCQELYDLWDKPSQALEDLFNLHRSDITILMTRLFWEQKEWEVLENNCIGTIDDIVSSIHSVASSKPRFWELCAWRWDLWNGLLTAVHARRTRQEAQEFISAQVSRCFPSGVDAKDRPLRLTYIKLRQHIGVSMLEDCKVYFQHFLQTPSCFNDLKPIVCGLPPEELVQFQHFMAVQAKDFTADLQKRIDDGADAQTMTNSWKQCHIVWLKFQYLCIMLSPPRHVTGVERFLKTAARTSYLFPDDPELGCLVIYMLLNLHHSMVQQYEGRSPLERRANSRLLLQATMFARHLIDKDKDKENRTLSLLAARLHLNLGLGTIAFRLYSNTKCKEMLLDTLSPYMLSRISQTHPFEVKGRGGFSADEELERTIGTIERMERKTESFLATDVSSFKWDQATDTIGLKRKLASSLTKHLCVVERRRIARLKGEPVDGLPNLDFKSHNEIWDNVDCSIFPDFEVSSQPTRVLHLIMPNSIPNVQWIPELHFCREKTSQILYQEGDFGNFDAVEFAHNLGKIHQGIAKTVRAEILMRKFWLSITDMTYAARFYPQQYVHAPQEAERLLSKLRSSRKGFEKLRMPGNTTLKAEDEPTMFHENMLMWCYGLLDVCRAIHKLTELYKDKVMKGKGKPHPLKGLLPDNWVQDLEAENAIQYQAIRDVAQSYMDLLMKRGVLAIKAQVRWGSTGECLKDALSDDDVEYYAKEYVESAHEAWSGVLKVKLK